MHRFMQKSRQGVGLTSQAWAPVLACNQSQQRLTPRSGTRGSSYSFSWVRAMTSRPRPAGEHGQVTAIVAVIFAGLLLTVGLVWDGALILGAHRRALNLAEGAARAGAQALDEPAYRAGVVGLDPPRARALAAAYLRATGEADEHTVQVRGDQVQVTVTITQPLALLRLAGLGSRTVTGQASARAVRDLPGGPG